MKQTARDLRLGGENAWENETNSKIAQVLNQELGRAYKHGKPFKMRIDGLTIANFRVLSLDPVRTSEYRFLRIAPGLIGKYAVQAMLFEEVPEAAGFQAYSVVSEWNQNVAVPTNQDTLNSAAKYLGLDHAFWLEAVES